MSTSSTTVRNLFPAVLCFSMLVLAAGGTRAKECSSSKGLATNYIYSLVGKKDTLWVLALKDNSVAFSMIAGESAFENPTEENNWRSYSPDCMGEYENLIYDGGIYALASFDTVDNQLWLFDHETGQDKRVSFRWPGVSDSVPDSLYLFYCMNAVWAQEKFYLACNDGGLVLWDPAESGQTVIFPGNTTSHVLSRLKKVDLTQRKKPDEKTDERVINIHHLHGDSTLLVVTGSKLWIHRTADSSWDSSIASDFDDNTVTFKRYESVFINTLDPLPVLYGTITVRFKNEKQDSTVFCKYNPAADKWGIMFDTPPKSLTFGHRRTIYALFDEERPGGALLNIIRIYRDTNDTTVIRNPKTLSIDNDIHERMTATYDIDSPEAFNDVLYIPRSDTTGYLWIATSEGLFVAEDEVAGKNNKSPFTLIKLAPKLSTGLKKTYARPGILSPGVTDCTFIYNIKADEADVTIRVFDYNMDHVKTIIHKQRRFSGVNGGPLGRSTVESEDRWDGKNAQGRDCAPGLYYYKITTSSGERAFGKIVIAR